SSWNGQRNIGIYDLVEKTERRLSFEGNQCCPVWTPDGRFLVFSDSGQLAWTRSDGSGNNRIDHMAAANQSAIPWTFSADGKWLVSEGGAISPVWSPDGSHLFFRGVDRRVMAVSYSTRAGAFIPGKPSVWTEKRMGDVGPVPSFDVGPDGNRIVALLDIEEAK